MAHNPLLSKAYNAEGAINPYCIVKVGANDYGALQATAATDHSIGVSTEITSATGDTVDVIHIGIADVKLGGTVARGDKLTSDANGNGVTAAPAAGTNNWVIGTALISGVSGDIIPVLLGQGTFQG